MDTKEKGLRTHAVFLPLSEKMNGNETQTRFYDLIPDLSNSILVLLSQAHGKLKETSNTIS